MMVALTMVPYLGTVRFTPLTSSSPYKRQISTPDAPISFPRNWVSSSRRLLRAWPQSCLARGAAGGKLPAEQSEIIFVGTGTSEGVPRVSCLTDPVKKCPVCTKAAVPGNKNRRLNTSVLVCYSKPSGRCAILIRPDKLDPNPITRSNTRY
ncbi:uncharacterized protein LOC120208515 [Hibiscus syriacus]|uniref:uncharacterized protein LOC120208515 n=1 Tax=Hibiscus syriacus TaxID=106335 RepID=UPI001923BB17|nr:uncharacterized protein LOC120208515 [Hibiscus syriacus]